MAKTYKIEPFFLAKPWGGQKLAKIRNAPSDISDGIGECWEFSLLSEGRPSINGKKIDDALSLSELGAGSKFVVKWIEATAPLSIQVHPDDLYAHAHESQNGKTECWLIWEAEVGAGLYLGLKPGVDARKLRKIKEENQDMSQCLNFVPVKKGDFFVVPAGTLHAIGAGVVLLEVQQASGVTYRAWDWNRTDENGAQRPLHWDKVIDVLVTDPQKNTAHYFFKSNILVQKEMEKVLFRHEDFQTSYLKMTAGEEYLSGIANYLVYFAVISGEVEVAGEKYSAFDSFVVPSETDNEVNLKATKDSLLIRVY